MTKAQRLKKAVDFLGTLGFCVYVTTQKRGAEGLDYTEITGDEAVVIYEEKLETERWVRKYRQRLEKEGY
jgi:hypothetical protein